MVIFNCWKGGRALTIPADALIDAGTMQYAFVVHNQTHFEPRMLKVGKRSDDRVEILSGLAEGDEVVTSANFLIDSESRLQAAISAMGRPPPERMKGTGNRNMIRSIIDFCARNIVVVIIGTVFAVAGAVYSINNIALDAIPDLSDATGDCLHRVDGAESGPGGGPGELTRLYHHFSRRRGDRCAGVLDVRDVVCLCHF